MGGPNYSRCLSDHKPLRNIFDESKPIPTKASAQLQRWALILSAYDYAIAYKPGAQNSNADLLSRLPLPDTPMEAPIPEETVLLMDILQFSSITATHIKAWTAQDPVLSRVAQRILSGWKDTCREPRQELSRKLSIRGTGIDRSQLKVRPTYNCGQPAPAIAKETIADHSLGDAFRIGCFPGGLWNQLSQEFQQRPLDGSRKVIPHQLHRLMDCVSVFAVLCLQHESNIHSTPAGQHDSYCLSEQNGWDPLVQPAWLWMYGSSTYTGL